MWALVENGSIIKRGKQVTHNLTINGVSYPNNITKVWSKAELKALGIIPITKKGASMDGDLEYGTGFTETITEDEVIRQETKSERNVDQVKDSFLSQVTTQQSSLLTQTDWVIIRSIDKGSDVPSSPVPKHIKDYRDAIRAKAVEMEEAINATVTIADLKAIKLTTDENGVKSGVLFDWPLEEDFIKV